MAACPHGYASPGSCWDCMMDGGLGVTPAVPVTVEQRTTARYDGRCPDCNLPISAGIQIALLSTGRWVHDGCVNRLKPAPLPWPADSETSA